MDMIHIYIYYIYRYTKMICMWLSTKWQLFMEMVGLDKGLFWNFREI